MKKAVTEHPTEDIVHIKELKQGSIYAYSSKKGSLAILTKLGNNTIDEHYGFVLVHQLGQRPVFTSNRKEKSIELAMNKGQTVYQFKSLKDLINWIE